MQRETIMKRINKKLKTMPYYIQEYCNSKLSYPYSICTIDAYLNDFQIFLKWMINEKLTFGSEMREIKTTNKSLSSQLVFCHEVSIIM